MRPMSYRRLLPLILALQLAGTAGAAPEPENQKTPPARVDALRNTPGAEADAVQRFIRAQADALEAMPAATLAAKLSQREFATALENRCAAARITGSKAMLADARVALGILIDRLDAAGAAINATPPNEVAADRLAAQTDILEAILCATTVAPRDLLDMELCKRLTQAAYAALLRCTEARTLGNPAFAKQTPPHDADRVTAFAGMLEAAVLVENADLTRDAYRQAIEGLRETLKSGREGLDWRGDHARLAEVHDRLLIASVAAARRGDRWPLRSAWFGNIEERIALLTTPGHGAIPNAQGGPGGSPAVPQGFWTRAAVLGGSPVAYWILGQQGGVDDDRNWQAITARRLLPTSDRREPRTFLSMPAQSGFVWRSGWTSSAHMLWYLPSSAQDAHLDGGNVGLTFHGIPALTETGNAPDGGDSGACAAPEAHNLIHIDGVTLRPGLVEMRNILWSGTEGFAATILSTMLPKGGTWNRTVRWDPKRFTIADQIIAPGVEATTIGANWHIGSASEPKITGSSSRGWTVSLTTGSLYVNANSPVVVEVAKTPGFVRPTGSSEKEDGTHYILKVRSKTPVRSLQIETTLAPR